MGIEKHSVKGTGRKHWEATHLCPDICYCALTDRGTVYCVFCVAAAHGHGQRGGGGGARIHVPQKAAYYFGIRESAVLKKYWFHHWKREKERKRERPMPGSLKKKSGARRFWVPARTLANPIAR